MSTLAKGRESGHNLRTEEGNMSTEAMTEVSVSKDTLGTPRIARCEGEP